jgi:ATP-dependent RNA circularization protein (DNA/RNA ligase family)
MMSEYHKINSVFKRDPETNNKRFILSDYAQREFEFLKDVEWVWTEKVDGTNIRVMWDGAKVTFGGKTDNAQIPATLVQRLIELFPDGKFAGKEPMCLYGEGYGAKIQGCGGNYRQDQSFVLFDVRVGDLWLQREQVEEVAKEFGIDVVPIVGSGSLDEAIEFCKSGYKSAWGDFKAEGIVLRPRVELKTRSGERVITKLKYKDF